jgi:hypothetical protein
VLTFDENIGFGTAEVTVEGPNGSATEGLTFSFGNEVRQRLRPGLPDGRYTVEYQVESGFGGDRDRGDFTFRIEAGAAPAPTTPPPTRKPSPTPTEEKAERTPEPRRTKIAPAAASARRVVEPVETAEPTSVPAPDVAGVASTRDEWLPPPVFWWCLLAVLAVGGYKALQWNRKRLAAVEAAEAGVPAGMPEPVRAHAAVVAPRAAGAGGSVLLGSPPSTMAPSQWHPSPADNLATVPAGGSPEDTDQLPAWTSRRDRRAYPPAELATAAEPPTAPAGVATATDTSGWFQPVPSAWSQEPTSSPAWPQESAQSWSQHGATTDSTGSWSPEPDSAWPPAPGSSAWPTTSAWSGADTTPPADK